MLLCGGICAEIGEVEESFSQSIPNLFTLGIVTPTRCDWLAIFRRLNNVPGGASNIVPSLALPGVCYQSLEGTNVR